MAIMRIAPGIFIAITVTLACQAQEGRRPGRGFFGPNIGFTTLDTNSDGILDPAEIEAAPTSLAKLDRNSDGSITLDEVRAAMPQGRGRGRGGADERRGERDGEQGLSIG